MRIRKFKKPHRQHRIFLVICEGETEAEYINLLRRHYRLPIVIKTKVVGNNINARLVRKYIDELEVSPEECRVFYVYDADVKPVLDKIKTFPGTAIISNPCIELWFVLHVRDYTRLVTSDSIIKELCLSNPLWKSYAKGGLDYYQSQYLLSSMEVAIGRAKKMKWPDNPSSNMYDFIEALESEKR